METIKTVVLDIPVNINRVESEYLMYLSSRQTSLGVKKSENGFNLRSRKYEGGEVPTFERNISTTQIRNLIDKGFLLKIDELSGYYVLKPNPNIISYLRNSYLQKDMKNKDISFDIDFVNGKYSFKYLKELTSNERQKLLSKARKVYRTSAYELDKKALSSGINTPSLFEMTFDNEKHYVISGISRRENFILEVYPEGLAKYPTFEKAEYTFNVSDKEVHIYSKEYSTTIANAVYKEYTKFNTVMEKLEELKKLCKQKGVKLQGFSKVKEQLKSCENYYNDALVIYDLYWKDYVKLAKNLEKEGVYLGGDDNNPKEVKLREKGFQLDNLFHKPKVRPVIMYGHLISEYIKNVLEGNVIKIKL